MKQGKQWQIQQEYRRHGGCFVTHHFRVLYARDFKPSSMYIEVLKERDLL